MQIQLPRGLFALIDEDDFPVVGTMKWSVMLGSHGKFYALRRIEGRTAYMHRLVVGATPGQVVDHINGDTLDNRKTNLRIGTLSDNAVNRAYTSASGYRGVFKQGSRWRAHIYRDHKKKHELGTFASPEEAAVAYDEAAKRLHGQFAITNFTSKEGISNGKPKEAL